ncbi:hypothetical protein [Mangrovibacterium lignilyticum]|uniref:hypothetical protein n=1 Tax=Mangrovibacterium lignilyticum TaxID=2668052 RepID=UPI0013D4A70E|nr:hypothetical protein [Mangrovibacterium lignilyticum]
MKPKIKITKDQEPLKHHRVHYLHMQTNNLYKPCRDNKGIHCTGNKLEYIVDWEITTKEKVNFLKENF